VPWLSADVGLGLDDDFGELDLTVAMGFDPLGEAQRDDAAQHGRAKESMFNGPAAATGSNQQSTSDSTSLRGSSPSTEDSGRCTPPMNCCRRLTP
jgi:hypothetical protein